MVSQGSNTKSRVSRGSCKISYDLAWKKSKKLLLPHSIGQTSPSGQHDFKKRELDFIFSMEGITKKIFKLPQRAEKKWV